MSKYLLKIIFLKIIFLLFLMCKSWCSSSCLTFEPSKQSSGTNYNFLISPPWSSDATTSSFGASATVYKKMQTRSVLLLEEIYLWWDILKKWYIEDFVKTMIPRIKFIVQWLSKITPQNKLGLVVLLYCYTTGLYYYLYFTFTFICHSFNFYQRVDTKLMSNI